LAGSTGRRQTTPPHRAQVTRGLLLKGVQAVVAAPGSRPVPLRLIEVVTGGLARVLGRPGSLGGVARELRRVQLARREELLHKAAEEPARRVHPLHWAGMTFHGVPW
jgi:hypothetical protein